MLLLTVFAGWLSYNANQWIPWPADKIKHFQVTALGLTVLIRYFTLLFWRRDCFLLNSYGDTMWWLCLKTALKRFSSQPHRALWIWEKVPGVKQTVERLLSVLIVLYCIVTIFSSSGQYDVKQYLHYLSLENILATRGPACHLRFPRECKLEIYLTGVMIQYRPPKVTNFNFWCAPKTFRCAPETEVGHFRGSVWNVKVFSCHFRGSLI